MGATLTAEDFSDRKSDLSRAIALAEADYFNAAFKAQTGSATTDDVSKAKAHHEQLKADLEALEAAWAVAQAKAATASADAAQASFDAMRADNVQRLESRRDAVTRISAAAKALAAAARQYEDATAAIRTSIAPFMHGAGQSSRNLQGALNIALDPDTWTALQAAGCILGDAGVTVSSSLRTQDCFGDIAPVDMEDRLAARILAALDAFSPARGA